MAVLLRTTGKSISLSDRCIRLLTLVGIVGIVLTCSVACCGGLPLALTYRGNAQEQEGGHELDDGVPGEASHVAGTYHCYGHEKGLMAHAGVLFLYEDGMAGFNGREGEWTYDKDTKTVQFTGGITFDRVDYDPEQGELEVRVEPGLTRSHADQGVMYCSPMQQ